MLYEKCHCAHLSQPMTLNSENESHTDKFWYRELIKENVFILVENKMLVGQCNYITAFA